MDKALNIDLSGGPNSWFDFWHTHVDWNGKGNTDWKTREAYLKKLLKIFNDLRLKLQHYPHDFQLWLVIYENDSGADSVYLHTRNPNRKNFPLKVRPNKKSATKNQDLKKFVDSLDLHNVSIQTKDGSIYYLFDTEVGTQLT